MLLSRRESVAIRPRGYALLLADKQKPALVCKLGAGVKGNRRAVRSEVD